MRRRCLDEKSGSYSRYGGRGIRVCDRWQVFEDFLEDMGEAPTDQHTVDRENPDGNYEPGNCKWATTQEQLETRRRGLKADDVRFIRSHPEILLRELAEQFGVTETAISFARTGKTWTHVQ